MNGKGMALERPLPPPPTTPTLPPPELRSSTEGVPFAEAALCWATLLIHSWTATIVSGPAGAKLVGSVTVPFINGIAQFSEMVIDTAGDKFVLEFTVTLPC